MVLNANSKKVGVIGLGSVGKAVLKALEYFYTCIGFDIIGDYSWDTVVDTDIVFICVPTPEGLDGHLDCSEIDVVHERLVQSKYNGLVVIKSTVRVGYMEKAVKRFSQLRLVYMPEFLRERSSYVWFVNPDRIVVSGDVADVEQALSYFHWVEDAEILAMDYRSAEVGKLAHNAFIATKVSFTNEIESICNELGADPTDVLSVIWADRRVKSREHLKPFLGPYGGKCVPKDTRELLLSSSKSTLLKAVERVNEDIRQKHTDGDD